MRLTRPGFAMCTVALAALAAGCGSSSSSSSTKSPQAWVKSVCNAVVPFKSDLTSREQALSSAASSSGGNLSTVKQEFRSFLSSVAADSSTVTARISAAGTPNVSNGKQIESRLVSALRELTAAFQKAQSQAGGLSTGSASTFASGAQQIGASIQSSVGGLQGDLQGLKTGSLEKIAKSTPACASLNASS